MRGFLIGWDGVRTELPSPVRWRLEYTTGVPCDSFDLECHWKPGKAEALERAVRFVAEEKGETVFSGVVDECVCGWDGDGGRLAVSGRGVAALLLDNEALGADYQVATLEDILRDHVSPYGIAVGETVRLPAVPGFSVATGSSEWQVLHSFVRYHGGITPRFDRSGRLVIAPWRDGKHLVLDRETPVLALSYRYRRYGVLSEILVRDRTTEAVQRVVNQSFTQAGGRCRRVLTMPGRSSYQAMRYSGNYQLDRAAENLRQVEIKLPYAFAAQPGDLVELQMKQEVCQGRWRVLACETGVGDAGAYSTLTLGEP